MDERLIEALNGFTRAIRQLQADVQSLRQESTDLSRRIAAIEAQPRGVSAELVELLRQEIRDTQKRVAALGGTSPPPPPPKMPTPPGGQLVSLTQQLAQQFSAGKYKY